MSVLPEGLSKFLSDEKSAVVSVAIDGDGTIHGAALLFVHNESPLSFFFVTNKNTEKCYKTTNTYH